MTDEYQEKNNQIYSEDDNSKEDQSIDFYENYYEKKNEEKEKKEKEKQIEKEKIENDKIYCKNCEIIPEIRFLNNQYINLVCKCKEIQNYTLKQFIDNNIINDKEGKIIANCKAHNNKKFINYCKDCFCDICLECNLKSKAHYNHTLLNFFCDSKIKEIEKTIKDYENNFEDDEANYEDDDKNIIKIFKHIIKVFNKYPCYNLFKSIENAYNFLPLFGDKKKIQFLYMIPINIMKKIK